MAEKIYRVPFGEGASEYVEKRSRFLGRVFRVKSEAEAQEYLRQIRAEHYDARHNCWCMRIGESVERYSDDGEPQGTAGQPMLKVFQRENVTDVLCVVTRYFGGILLGAGGLTRAYGKTAKDALSAAGAATMGRWSRVRIDTPYPLLERVKGEIAAAEGTVDTTEYGAAVTVEASVLSAQVAELNRRLQELSAGALRAEPLGEEYRPGPREEVR